MAFELHHILTSSALQPTKRTSGEDTFFTVAAAEMFDVLYPGRLDRDAAAFFTRRFRISDPAPGPVETGDPGDPGLHPGSQGGHGGWQMVEEHIPLKLRIFDPAGAEFTAGEVTLADLRKHRDLRGTPVGQWRYELSGESEHFQLDEDDLLTGQRGTIVLAVHETVPSESAPPLVKAALDASRRSFKFDLFRVGRLTAEVTQTGANAPWHGTMTLHDPDGRVVASTAGRTLTFEVGLGTLARSRDSAGNPRLWMLEVAPQGGVVVGSPRLTAQVIGGGRITTSTIAARITRMIGPPDNQYLRIYGENSDGYVKCRLVITDVGAAETLDMHGVLQKLLQAVPQDPGVDPYDLRAGTAYTLFQRSETYHADGIPVDIDVESVYVERIDVVVDRTNVSGTSIPVVKFKVDVSGEAVLSIGGLVIGSVSVSDGTFEVEVGIDVSGGTPQLVTWVPDDAVDVSLSSGALAAAAAGGLLAGPLGALLAAGGVEVFSSHIENLLNASVANSLRSLFDPDLAPRVLMTMFGAHLTYRPVVFDGDDVIFEYVAPLEPDAKPRESYVEVIGRGFVDLDLGIRFTPESLGDTWAAPNLAKVDHIVVVMMENRSYDHVLGYRAQPIAGPHGHPGDGADGLTRALIETIMAADGGHTVRPLSQAGFVENSVHKKTRIPRGVGHSLANVRQQLSGRAPGPDGTEINDPKGFVDSFAAELAEPPGPRGLVPDDVLGYYTAGDLPFFKHLADNYAYCDHYFCSHPGPTLPNRMYSLTGDVQYDRFGVPILDNNHGDNFLLSRATTIYDVLTKLGVSWRVYESFPSITMLRMYARYATNDTDIRRYDDRFALDVANGDLPAFTVVEPAMHSHPENDDHPDADMWRGQIFLQGVYETLRSNRQIWEKTLLIITYDEHGGLYDHRVPPVAELLRAPTTGGVVGGGVGTTLAPEGDAPPVGHGHGHLGGNVVDVVGLTAGDAPPPAEPPASLPIIYGLRVPTFVVSPLVAPGKGPEIVLDHCSILKTVLARFAAGAKPFLTERVAASHTFDAFLAETQPRLDVPWPGPLAGLQDEERRLAPGGSAIETPPLSRKEMREGPVDFHVLSGRLARMLGR